MKDIELFRKELEEILKVSHLGNLQIQIYDKLLIHYVESDETDYDEDDNEMLKSMTISTNFYGDWYEAVVVECAGDGFEIQCSQGGELLEVFDNKIEVDLQPYIKILWNRLQEFLNS